LGLTPSFVGGEGVWGKVYAGMAYCLMSTTSAGTQKETAMRAGSGVLIFIIFCTESSLWTGFLFCRQHKALSPLSGRQKRKTTRKGQKETYGGKCNYIISGDKHLLQLGEYEGIKIMKAPDFCS